MSFEDNKASVFIAAEASKKESPEINIYKKRKLMSSKQF